MEASQIVRPCLPLGHLSPAERLVATHLLHPRMLHATAREGWSMCIPLCDQINGTGWSGSCYQIGNESLNTIRHWRTASVRLPLSSEEIAAFACSPAYSTARTSPCL